MVKSPQALFTYESVGSGSGQQGILDRKYQWAGSDSVLSEVQYAKGEDLQMFPTMAGAVVVVYNNPSITSSQNFALDRATLAKIYLGTVTHWDDPAIVALNPGITLNNDEIMLVVREDKSGTTEIFTEGLASFDTSWANTIGISNKPNWPKKHFTGVKNDGLAQKVLQVQNSIGYLTFGRENSKSCSLPVVHIKNKAGLHTTANTTSIQSAISDYQASAIAGGDITRFHTTLIDGPGAASYPFVAFTYMIVRKEYKSTQNPCPLVEEMIRYMFWALSDPQPLAIISAQSFVPLTAEVTAIVVFVFSNMIFCDNTLVSRKVFVALTGSGASFPAQVYAEWVAAYSQFLNDESFRVTYASIGSGNGRTQLYANQTIYAGSDSLVKDADYALMPGIRMFPSLAGAVVLIYNIPETGTTQITLSRENVGEIFMGTITKWNDAKIAANNPSLTLPNQNILLIVRSDKSGTVEILTKALNSMSPAWSSSIGVSSQPSWPKADITLSGSSQIPKTVIMTNYSMGFVVLSDALSSPCFEASIPFAKIRNKAGNDIVANSKSIQSAMDDNIDSLSDLSRLTSDLADGPGADSYPIAGYTYIVYFVENTGIERTCSSVKALIDYAFWFMDTTEPSTIAESKGMAVLSLKVKQIVKELLYTTTCEGKFVVPKPDLSTATDLTQIYTLIGVLVVIGLIVGYIFYRVRKNQKRMAAIEAELNDNSIWRIELREIEFKQQGGAMGSQVGSLASMASMGSKMSMGSQKSLRSNKKDESERQVFTVIGKYNGLTVAVKKMNKNELKITREIQKEFRLVRELRAS